MFLLSKILPLLLLPLGIVFLLLLLFALRGGRWLLISSLSVLWIFSLPLTAEGLWRWLEHPFKRRTVPSVVRDLSPSAVVVLGIVDILLLVLPGSVNGVMLIDFLVDLMLFLSSSPNTGLKLIFTGGWSPTQPDLPSEGSVLRHRAISLVSFRYDLYYWESSKSFSEATEVSKCCNW